MPEKKVSIVFNIRSVSSGRRILRDFSGPTAFAGYVLTDFARACIGARGVWSEPEVWTAGMGNDG